ncbi:uncharacterized protein LOC129809357 [Phlebotomus papatasi]|uniref:uncharacterized protein LOC129809357 n=1 Tax=Phlebotomus papatasi TaxID=29031 RepID=UPI002483A53E|nr:uncharacterized protein LOC129809357 [Phlebotomus papatasi]
MLMRLRGILLTRRPLGVLSGRLFCSQTERKASKHDLGEGSALKYIGSNAGSWAAQQSRRGPKAQGVWYQPYVVALSVTIFMIYFCILREENDIDLELQKSLYERIEGLEEAQLRIRHKYNLENGLDVKEIEARLEELGAKV